MAASPPPVYPPSLSDAETEHLVRAIQDWCAGNGLQVRPAPTVIAPEADPRRITAVAAPVTMFPSPFPRQCFAQAMEVQTTYNELYAAVSRDEEFIEQTVKDVIQGDEFIKNLWDIHKKVKEEGYTQSLSLGLFRSDYMVHQDTTATEPSYQIKQIEFNTIAASFGCLSYYTGALHKHLAAREYPWLKNAIPPGTMQLPSNDSIHGLAQGIETAFNAYPASISPAAATAAASPSSPATTTSSSRALSHAKCIVFLVQSAERNVMDQRHLEYRLADLLPDVPLFRLTFADIKKHTTVADTPERQLLYHSHHHHHHHHGDGDGSGSGGGGGRLFEVAVVYLRAGYGPADYPDDAAWDARLHIERSAAIKCPTVLTQLAGTKKVQQVLATPQSSSSSSSDSSSSPSSSSSSSVLDRFFKRNTNTNITTTTTTTTAADQDKVAQLRRTFTNIYPLDTSPAGLAGRALALDPVRAAAHVLKPQREGGGNNVYGAAIPDFLRRRSVPESHWGSYILMELITPPPLPAANNHLILRAGRVIKTAIVCELGVYGACLWHHRSGEIHHNQVAGYLLRTKEATSGEGGVDAGFGCLDSCCLV